MSEPRRIQVMISSRNNDPIRLDGRRTKLSAVRKRIKADVEAVELFGSRLFEVWINEDAPPAEGAEDSWEHCMRQVREADLVLVLYNGNAGWARHDGEIGICHGELEHGLDFAPAKVRIIALDPLVDGNSPERDERFRTYMGVQNRFWATARSGEEVIDHCSAALRDAVPAMVALGLRDARRGKFSAGAALDWSRMDYESRKEALETTLRDALVERGGSEEARGVLLPVAGHDLYFLCHGIPAAVSVAAAREMVGQPHLHDHESAGHMRKASGPVHLIACHRGVTERQAASILGFPDATIISTPFGVYVADGIQRIQLVFIKECRDDTSTRVGVQRVFEWLAQSGEEELLSARAQARARIVQAIALETDVHPE